MIWNKKDIELLSESMKEQWFDVYNYELLEDRGYDITIMSDKEIKDASNIIKNDYYKYLEGLIKDENFIFYSCISNNGVLVSVCRVVKKNEYYFIEGLETHHRFRKQGYGLKVLKEVLAQSKTLGIKEVYSKIRVYNKASISTHIKLGFKVYKQEEDNIILIIQLAK